MRSFIRPYLHSEPALLHEQFMYGHKETLFKIHKFPQNKYIRAQLQHGWIHHLNTRHTRANIVRDKKGKPFPLLVWSERIAKEYKLAGVRDVRVVGAPAAHYISSSTPKRFDNQSISKENEVKQDKLKIIYFPSHSFHGAEAQIDLTILDELRNFGEVTVSLYWMDFLDPRLRTNIGHRDCKIVCFGYRGASAIEAPWSNVGGRENFLIHLIESLKRYDAIIVDDISSVFLYAIILDKKIGFTRGESNWKNKGSYIKNDLATEYHDNIEILERFNINDLNIREIKDPSDSLKNFAITELGLGHLHELKNFLSLDDFIGTF